MSDTQLTIGGEELDEQLYLETTGRVIRPFRRMIDPVVDEFKLRASNEGLHVRAVDSSNVMYVDVTLPAGELDTIDVAGDETMLGVASDALGSALSDARYGTATNDPVTIRSDGPTLETVVERDYSGVDATVTDRMGLIDPDSIRAIPDLINLDRTSIDIPPRAFIDLVGSFDRSEHITLAVDDGTLRFAGESDTHARQVSLDVDADGDVTETYFSKPYLKKVADGLASGYAESATMHLADELPMSVECETEQGLRAEYTLAPRIQSD